MFLWQMPDKEKGKGELKTDNLCCPRIGAGYIKNGDKILNDIRQSAAAAIALK